MTSLNKFISDSEQNLREVIAFKKITSDSKWDKYRNSHFSDLNCHPAYRQERENGEQSAADGSTNLGNPHDSSPEDSDSSSPAAPVIENNPHAANQAPWAKAQNATELLKAQMEELNKHAFPDPPAPTFTDEHGITRSKPIDIPGAGKKKTRAYPYQDHPGYKQVIEDTNAEPEDDVIASGDCSPTSEGVKRADRPDWRGWEKVHFPHKK